MKALNWIKKQMDKRQRIIRKSPDIQAEIDDNLTFRARTDYRLGDRHPNTAEGRVPRTLSEAEL